ncbi:Uncharacterised protein [Candidatus Burarchaeum australiense]|nr:Uncharacterised protein [Candidatus Burarchaeum australiense]
MAPEEKPIEKAVEKVAERTSEKQAEKQAEKKDDVKKRELEKKEEKKDEMKEQAVIAIRDISIALDTYDDIYSDFDPRPHAEREISADLLKELERRALIDAKGRFEIRFFLPKALRDEKTEAQIKKRLQAYFRMKCKEAEKENNARKVTSALYIIAGLAALFSYAILLTFTQLGPFGSFLDVLLVPIGWFFLWEGLAKLLLQERKVMDAQIKFYQDFSKANFIFLSEEENVLGATQEQTGA